MCEFDAEAFSALRGIVLVEFDNTVGPRIAVQYPEGCVGADVFEACSEFFITKPDISGRLTSVVWKDRLYVGVPQCLEGRHYERNAFMFNVVFVLDAPSGGGGRPTGGAFASPNCGGPHPYEEAVRKVAWYMRNYEVDSAMLRPGSRKESTIARVLKELVEGLNGPQHMCSVVVDESGEGQQVIHVRLWRRTRPLDAQRAMIAMMSAQQYPPPKELLRMIPLLRYPIPPEKRERLDFTLQAILPSIDSVSSIEEIAHRSSVEVALVIHAIRQLTGLGWCSLVENRSDVAYELTPKFRQLLSSRSAMNRIAENVSTLGIRKAVPVMMKFLAALSTGQEVAALIARHAEYADKFNFRALLDYCMLEGYIRRLPQR